ncbi:hypothetical protein CDAR_62481 [Caerostris darwini]|uniref:Uncharacterized protein n=1 Tax=Caerostris darwini TaxID=1538125 RepID=A0AAV4UF31_9ARAC|nr:hypothetical protein CDAR_62481 [Caerostris darwini]
MIPSKESVGPLQRRNYRNGEELDPSSLGRIRLRVGPTHMYIDFFQTHPGMPPPGEPVLRAKGTARLRASHWRSEPLPSLPLAAGVKGREGEPLIGEEFF